MRQYVAALHSPASIDAGDGLWHHFNGSMEARARTALLRPAYRVRGRGLATVVRRILLGVLATLAILAIPSTTLAHSQVPAPLREVQVPPVPGLLSGRAPIVRNRAQAIALGKALFWDIQVGSDGMACASCHYHAGTDARLRNQLAPGRSGPRPTATTFEPMASGARGGPNYTLRLADFPLHRLADPASFGSEVLFTTDDIVGSAGSFGGEFQGAHSESPFDNCIRTADPTFNVHAIGTRRVTSRNAPSVINAVFHRRTFWDGRANNVFNGVSAFGERDADARVWMWRRGRLRAKRLALVNSSLASQAVSPPLDTSEMSCAGRTFADIGRKLVPHHPLQFQAVHPEDSVLARHRDRSGMGLKPTYAAMIRKAFGRRYWAAPRAKAKALGSPAAGGESYSQMEANFALFFGLSVQLYQATLVSDQAPFDGERDEQGVPVALSEQQRRGLAAFTDLHCSDCHAGPTFSGAEAPDDPSQATDVDRKPVRSVSGPMTLGLVDRGFVNTGVVPLEDDPGVDGVDPFGNPLSFTKQYLGLLSGHPELVLDPLAVQSCVMTAPFAKEAFGRPAFAAEELTVDPAGSKQCSAPRWAAVPTAAVAAAEMAKPDQGRLGTGTSGAFKIPSLRNVELTGPYMHNGGMATLEEVLRFYNRGGNFSSHGKVVQFLFGFGVAQNTLDDIIAFLKSLTDERVRWEKAPFDHPALPIPDGHAGDENAVGGEAGSDFAGLAATRFTNIPAVGASGRDGALGPLRAFAERAQP
jgi:cytochrome c peroxidase